jgi:hypothetical protein
MNPRTFFAQNILKFFFLVTMIIGKLRQSFKSLATSKFDEIEFFRCKNDKRINQSFAELSKLPKTQTHQILCRIQSGSKISSSRAAVIVCCDAWKRQKVEGREAWRNVIGSQRKSQLSI